MRILDVVSLVLVGIVIVAIGYVVIVGGDFIGTSEMATKQGSSPEEIMEMRETSLPLLGRAPDLTGIIDWINTEPLTSNELRGKVVLVDFWTYSCINCIRTFPFVSSWHETYKDKGFTVLGVHTPEFEFEKEKANVVQATKDHSLKYPVAMDNDYATWNAFRNRYWPAHYLLDVDGNVRYVHFGEGQYAETEAAIQQLLFEAGLAEENDLLVPEVDVTSQRDVDTPEIYFGSKRNEFSGQDISGLTPGASRLFSAPSTLKENTLYFDGVWSIDEELALSGGRENKILLPYHAKDVHMVLAAEEDVVVEIRRDGKSLTEDIAGEDIYFEDGRSFAKVREARKYTFIRDESSGSHTFELITPTGLEAYTFTFG